MQGQPTEVDAQTTSLWDEQWFQTLWGNHLELDQADAAAFAAAKHTAASSGKGLQKGKGKRHWSSVAVHSDSYEPFPFDLNVLVVEAVYFSWDEYCDKFRKEDRKIGDYSVATVVGRPPVGVGDDLRSDHTASAQSSTAAPKAPAVCSQRRQGRKGS